jgi:hypothetical protein
MFGEERLEKPLQVGELHLICIAFTLQQWHYDKQNQRTALKCNAAE